MSKQRFHLKPICVSLLLMLAAQTAQANPIGAAVVNGQASIATQGNTLTVTNTPNTIINWQGFSIGANEITRFVQQSASSAVLNRVVTNNPSSILGSLQSNGRVFLVNPSGIVFGQGAMVNVGGLVATTLNLSNADFLAGRNSFTDVPGAQNISNAGNITAQTGGQIYLIAPNVDNSGVINAPNGEILLAAGRSVELVNSLDPNLRVNITAPAGNATNVGQLVASSGSLGLFGTVVRNSGTVSADSATMQGGKIVFKASQRADIAGTVSATGTTGGAINVLGNEVLINAGATLDASGTNGGGTVLVGGDAHGANPNVQNALNTYVDATATIKADATQNGNGGKVVVWADGTTQFNGNISAQGGALGGNGGWVEVSGKRLLGYNGLVNTTAAHGLTGSLLLDPINITISNAVTTAAAFVGAPGTYGGQSTSPATSNLNVTTLTNQLLASNVIITTDNTMGPGVSSITIQNSIAWNSAFGLTLNANVAGGTGSILVNATDTLGAALSISNTGLGGLTMNTLGGSITLNGAVNLLGGGALNMMASGATSNININAPITLTGAVTVSTLNAGASIFINKPITASMGGVTLIHGAAGSATVQPVPYIGNTPMLFLGGALDVQNGTGVSTGTLNLFNSFASVGGLTAAILNMNGAEIRSSLVTPALLIASGGVKFTGAPSALDNVRLDATGASSVGTVANPATLFMRNGAFINNAGSWTMSNGSSIIQEGLVATSFNNIATLTTPAGTSHIAGTSVTGAVPTGTWDTAAVITNSGIWDITGGPNNNNVSNLSQYATVSVINNPGAVMFSYDPTYVNPTIVPANVTFTNNGTLDIGAGSMSLSSSAVNNGIMNINGISWIDILAPGSLTNNGTINLGGPVANGAGYAAAPGYGDIRVYGGTFTNAAAGVLNSLPDWGGWNWVHAYAGTISNNGTVNVSNLSTLDWQNSNSSTNAGTFNVAAGGYLLVADPIARMLTVPTGAAYTFNGPINVAAGGILDAFGVLYTGLGTYNLGTLTPKTTLATATAPVTAALNNVVSTIVLPPPTITFSPPPPPPPLLQTAPSQPAPSGTAAPSPPAPNGTAAPSQPASNGTATPATDPNSQAAQDAAAAAAAAAAPATTTVAAAPLPVCQ